MQMTQTQNPVRKIEMIVPFLAADGTLIDEIIVTSNWRMTARTIAENAADFTYDRVDEECIRPVDPNEPMPVWCI